MIDAEQAQLIYADVCRTDFSSPGYHLLSLGPDAGSAALRRCMIDLLQRLRKVHQTIRPQEELGLLSLSRFDQQVATKPHRDSGPEECFLLLGYEPSSIVSEITLFDYSRCAHEHHKTPEQWLAEHNPMFGPGEQLLQPYALPIEAFSLRNYQVLLINNSSAAYSPGVGCWQGLLHTAAISEPDESQRRIVNSALAAPAPLGESFPVSAERQKEFIETDRVHRKGYDKPHLEDG